MLQYNAKIPKGRDKMPSSVIHLRVCDMLLDLVDERYHADFTVGNLAADCGRPVPGTKSYDPPRDVTHFTDTPQRWNTRTHPDRFREKYMKNCRNMRDLVFLCGYYCHLTVDNAYIDLFFEKYHAIYGEAFDIELRRKIKQRDQHYHDMKFLCDHTDFRPLAILNSIGGYPNRCLDYYSADAITERLIKVKQTELVPCAADMPDGLIVTGEECDGFVKGCADMLRGFVSDELRQTHCTKH